MNLLRVLASAVVILLLAGCWSSPGGIAASSTPINPEDSYTVVQRGVSSSDWALLLLTFPIGQPDCQAAMKRALQPVNADALINVTVDNSYACFLLFTIERTIVCGDAIKLQRAGKGLN